MLLFQSWNIIYDRSSREPEDGYGILNSKRNSSKVGCFRKKNTLCNEGRIAGAEKKGLMWLIPKDAEKPADLRYGKKQMTEENK